MYFLFKEEINREDISDFWIFIPINRLLRNVIDRRAIFLILLFNILLIFINREIFVALLSFQHAINK